MAGKKKITTKKHKPKKSEKDMFEGYQEMKEEPVESISLEELALEEEEREKIIDEDFN